MSSLLPMKWRFPWLSFVHTLKAMARGWLAWDMRGLSYFLHFHSVTVSVLEAEDDKT